MKQPLLFDLDPRSYPPPPLRTAARSKKRAAIIDYLRQNRTITLDQAVHLIGKNIFANQRHHVGALLARMIKLGLIKRERRAVYTLP